MKEFRLDIVPQQKPVLREFPLHHFAQPAGIETSSRPNTVLASSPRKLKPIIAAPDLDVYLFPSSFYTPEATVKAEENGWDVGCCNASCAFSLNPK